MDPSYLPTNNERYLFGEATRFIASGDSATNPQPLFAFIKTLNPHLPYTITDDDNLVVSRGKSLTSAYAEGLEQVDGRLGELLTFWVWDERFLDANGRMRIR